MTKIFDKYESEVKSYCRKFPAVFSKAKGCYMYDENGKEYLDFFCGAGSLNYGHNNDYIKDKVVEYIQNDGIIHSMDMHTAVKRDFISYLEHDVIEPRGLDYKMMFVNSSGANANEAALKLARKVTNRQGVFALMGGFHGMSLGALSITTESAARKGAGISLENVTHIPAPYMYSNFDTIQYMKDLIEDDHSGVEIPAALVIETVQAEGGVYVLSNEWLKRAEQFCHEYNILLIVDDIQVGNCRTGDFFSFERSGIKPDIITMAKSIGGIGMPFAMCLIKPDIDIFNPGEHNGTFRGFQPAFVAGKAALEYMNKYDVPQMVKNKSKIIEEIFTREIPLISKELTWRGMGMIYGIDFKEYPDGTAQKVSEECFKNGLIIELAGRQDSVLKYMPILVSDESDLVRGIYISLDAIKHVVANV